MITIELPWPSTELWPNRNHGKHWTVTSLCAAQARDGARVLMFEAMEAWRPECVSAALRVTFHAPTKRCYDLQNALSALKADFDGIADALGINDSKFDPITLARGSVRKPGCVVVEVDLL